MRKKLYCFTTLFTLLILSISMVGYFMDMHRQVVAVPSAKNEKLTLAAKNFPSNLLATLSQKNVQPIYEKTNTESTTKIATAITNNNDVPLSRGGEPPSMKSAVMKAPELLDWWKSARYVFSIGTIAEVTDLYTGKSFKIERTYGTNHADCEALTKNDTAVIKSIWGGFSWERRPVIITIDGRRLAASMSGMPHAGLDSKPANEIVNNRSDGFGTGVNLDSIKNNDMNGHFDIHFLNSTRHKDGEKDPQHQANVLIAAGR